MQGSRIVALLAFLWMGTAWHDSGAQEQAREAETAAIRKTAAQYTDALKRGDAAAMTAAWTKDGEYVDASGRVFKAVDLIKKQFPAGAVAREVQPREADVSNSRIRIVSGDVAIEDGASQTSPDDESAAKGRYTVVWKKQGGRWLIDSLRETVSSDSGADDEPSPDESRLKELAWLVGDWAGKLDKTSYELSAHFLDDDRVLELNFSVLRDGRRAVAGHEYVTRDPVSGEIKSSFIDSRGGHGEGIWTVDDDTWTAETFGALIDDTLTESTNRYTPHKDGSVTWSALNLRVGHESMPDVSVRFARKAAK